MITKLTFFPKEQEEKRVQIIYAPLQIYSHYFLLLLPADDELLFVEPELLLVDPELLLELEEPDLTVPEELPED